MKPLMLDSGDIVESCQSIDDALHMATVTVKDLPFPRRMPYSNFTSDQLAALKAEVNGTHHNDNAAGGTARVRCATASGENSFNENLPELDRGLGSVSAGREPYTSGQAGGEEAAYRSGNIADESISADEKCAPGAGPSGALRLSESQNNIPETPLPDKTLECGPIVESGSMQSSDKECATCGGDCESCDCPSYYDGDPLACIDDDETVPHDPPESPKASAESTSLRQSDNQDAGIDVVSPDRDRNVTCVSPKAAGPDNDSDVLRPSRVMSTSRPEHPVTLPLSHSDLRGESMEAIRAQHPESSTDYYRRRQRSFLTFKSMEQKEDTKLKESKEITNERNDDTCVSEEPKRTRTVFADTEDKALHALSKAHIRRNQRINKAKESYETTIEKANEGFAEEMKSILAGLEPEVKMRVLSYAEARFGKAEA